jgi:hypothetical protein
MPYALFMDESGDHNLKSIDNYFPAFCLAGCAFEREYYKTVARPAVDTLKMRFWGMDHIPLHSRDIRKHRGPFTFLGDEEKRQDFYAAINRLMEELDFTIIAVVILKNEHLNQYGTAALHPYHLSLEFIMERYSMLMRRRSKTTEGYIMSEARGKNEDTLLKNEYNNLKRFGTEFHRDMSNIKSFWMEKKEANIAGLQIADLIAYPIAAKVLRPDAEQKAFDILVGKIDAAPANKGGSILGYGLNIFPQPTFDHYRVFSG